MSRRAAVAAAAVLALAAPAVAHAHAKLVRSIPAPGTNLPRQPASMTFFFNEPIEVSFGVIRVYDAKGRDVESGKPFRPQGRSDGLAISLVPGLPKGAYRAVYRIISADSHPTVGEVDFTVGPPGAVVAQPSGPLPGQAGAGRTISVAFWADRWLGYLAIGLAVGALFFLLWAWRPMLAEEGGDGERWLRAAGVFDRRFRLLVGVAIGAGVLASLLALPLEAASAAGTSLWGGLHGGALDAVVHTRFGSLLIVRAAAWALLGAVLVLAAGRRPSIGWIAAAMVPLGSLLISPALAGHARSQSPQELLIPANVVHVTAMSLWLGGLALLALAVPAAARELEGPERGRMILGAVSRFSNIALASVVALAVSGVTQAVIDVGSFRALVDTGYGRTVLAKTLLLGLLIVLGANNREQLIPALQRAVGARHDPGQAWTWLRRNVRIETAVVAGVLAAAAVLVAMAPPVDTGGIAASPQGRISARTGLGDATLAYTVDPARTGVNQVNLFLLDARGRSYTRATRVTAAIDRLGIIPLERLGPGHYANTFVRFDAAGTYVLTVTARRSDGVVHTARVEIPVG